MPESSIVHTSDEKIIPWSMDSKNEALACTMDSRHKQRRSACSSEVIVKPFENCREKFFLNAGLAENRCLERRPQGAKLFQVGQQEIALGAKFRATVILDIQVCHVLFEMKKGR